MADAVKKTEVHRYVLNPRRAGAVPRAGALLRVHFDDFELPGHADLFPWREFGDPALETWLEELRSGRLSQTLRIAIQAARDEALAISKNEPLIKGSVINHALATDPIDLAVSDVMEARRGTFPAIKIKIGRHAPLEEAAALQRLSSHWGIRLRLDANERTTKENLLIFLDALPIRIRESLELIEDPFKFDLRAWSDFRRETGITIAYDRGPAERGSADQELEALGEIFSSGAAQVLIHKPAWQDDARATFARRKNIPVIVTSILGHPVGNIWAAAKASELAPDSVNGCFSHVAYKEDDASRTLIKSKQARGCRMVGIGVGLGLQSKWFNRLRWESLG